MIKTLRKNLYVLDHPVVSHNLAVVRDVNYEPERFRTSLKKILTLLMYESTKFLPTVEKEVTTPLCTTNVNILADVEIILAPILRAGLVFCEIAQDILPMARVQHLGMFRNEETLEPVWYYSKPFRELENPQNTYVFVLDPMIATGNSAYEAVSEYAKKNVPQKNIICVSLISAPEGIKRLSDDFCDVKVITAALDESLNARGYIVPGLGDAGDKAFNTLV